jgi:tRNA threonylcarbamoyladenosine biosynthesis protein TsaE
VSILSFISSTDDYTRKIAAQFATRLKGGEKISLIGPLGSGKTTFVRGFVEAFGISGDQVMSPTFTLVREYGTTRKIYHVDLYRLEREEEIFEAGIFDLITGPELVLIEWADRLEKHLPQDAITIRFSHLSPTTRMIELGEFG